MHRRHKIPVIPILAVAFLLVIAAAGALYVLSPRHSNPNNSTITTTASTTLTTSIRSGATQTTTSTAATTSVGSSSQLSEPAPQPSSQIVRMGANTTISDAGAQGGIPPYSYQWFAAVMNTSSNFTSSFGDFVCLNATAQSTTCNFQTVSGYNTLLPGIYYLKLHVSDSSSQSANSSVAYVDVIS